MMTYVAEYQFTVADYHRMGETGIFTEDDHVELINGRIVKMSPIGRKHFACVNRLTRLFTLQLTDQVVVSVQNPVVLSDRSEPEPDVTLLRPRDDFYEERLPEAADVLLLVEVSEATLRFDKEVKLPLYAESGVAEVWIIDLKTATVEVYAEPQNAIYNQQQTFKRGQSISPRLLPTFTASVQQLIG